MTAGVKSLRFKALVSPDSQNHKSVWPLLANPLLPCACSPNHTDHEGDE